MKRIFRAPRCVSAAFTLIELLVVIAIIGILASLLLVSLVTAKVHTQQTLTKADEHNLIATISQYHADYGRLPASSSAMAAAGTNDFTFGTTALNAPAGSGSIFPIAVNNTFENTYQNYNSEVITILRDENAWPETAAGRQHIYNPKKNVLLTEKLAMDTNSAGIGPDFVLRDIWGSPYIITLDLNEDQRCYDATLDKMYQLQSPAPSGPLLAPQEAIVWSFGPLRTVNLGQPLNSSHTNKSTLVISF